MQCQAHSSVLLTAAVGCCCCYCCCHCCLLLDTELRWARARTGTSLFCGHKCSAAAAPGQCAATVSATRQVVALHSAVVEWRLGWWNEDEAAYAVAAAAAAAASGSCCRRLAAGSASYAIDSATGSNWQLLVALLCPTALQMSNCERMS
jgi:hypothetical protein